MIRTSMSSSLRSNLIRSCQEIWDASRARNIHAVSAPSKFVGRYHGRHQSLLPTWQRKSELREEFKNYAGRTVIQQRFYSEKNESQLDPNMKEKAAETQVGEGPVKHELGNIQAAKMYLSFTCT